MSSIPAKLFVDVVPSVLPAGGNALALNGICVTQNTRVPIGSVPSFSSATAVGAYFGANSNEKLQADKYFKGFTNSTKRPGAMLFAQYPSSAVAAYLRGGSLGLTLAALQALNGTLTLTVDGSDQTGTANLSSASSFSAAAALIETALNTGTSVTGSVAANVVVGRIDPNVGTGSIAGTTMTISAVSTGGFAPGQPVSGTNVADGTTIVQQLTGTAGSTGTYQVSISQSVSSTAITAGGGTLNVSAVTSGTLAVGQTITGSGVTAGTTITDLLTGSGGTGKYAVSASQTVAPSTTITADGGTLTVSAVSTGTLGVGDVISGTNISADNEITAFLTGTGGTGTYLVSIGDTASSTTITVPGADVDVAYDSTADAFTITSGTTGAASTITAATGTLSASLKLTVSTGVVLSQGAAAASPAEFMDGITAVTTNWASFFLNFDPDVTGHANKLAFSEWVNDTEDRYVFVGWDTDEAPTVSSPASSSWGYDLQQADLSGTNLNWEPEEQYLAAFVSGTIASIDFTRKNGRISFAYRSQTGLVAGVSTETAAVNLGGNPQVTGSFGNGYNYFGAIGTANDSFINYQRGSISGPWQWLDSYVYQIWLNNALQLAILRFLTLVNSFPYNKQGYDLVAAACQDPINAALNFGAIRTGVPLSESQIADVNDAAGVKIDTILSTQGYFLQILPATAEVRASRGSPPMTLWYMDGGSIQSITLASIAVQ